MSCNQGTFPIHNKSSTPRLFLCVCKERERDPTKPSRSHQKKSQSCGKKGQLGDFNGKVLTNVNFKSLHEQLGLRGCQEYYDAYVEDLVIRPQEDGTEVVEFRDGPTRIRSGGLTIRQRTTPQVMLCIDAGGKTDPTRLFKLWLSKRPVGMKDTRRFLFVRAVRKDLSFCKENATFLRNTGMIIPRILLKEYIYRPRRLLI